MEEKEKDEDTSKESAVDEEEQQFLEQYYEHLNIRNLDVSQIVDRMNLLRLGSRSLEDIRNLESKVVKPVSKENVQPTASSSKQAEFPKPEPADTFNLDNIPAGCVRSEPSSPTRGGMFIHSLVDYFGNSSGDPFNKPHWPPAKSLRGKLKPIVATHFPIGLAATQRPGLANAPVPRPIVKTNWRQPNDDKGEPEPSTSSEKHKPVEEKKDVPRFKSTSRIPYEPKEPRPQVAGRPSQSGFQRLPKKETTSKCAKGGQWRAEMNPGSNQPSQTQIRKFPKEEWNQIYFQGIEQVDIAAKPIPILSSTKSTRTILQAKSEKKEPDPPVPSVSREPRPPEKYGYMKETIASKSKENSPITRKQSPSVPLKDSRNTKPPRFSVESTKQYKSPPGPSKKEVAKPAEEPPKLEQKQSTSGKKPTKLSTPFMTRAVRSDESRFEPDFSKYHRKEKKGKGKEGTVKSKSSGSLYAKKHSLTQQRSSDSIEPIFERRDAAPTVEAPVRHVFPPASRDSFQAFQRKVLENVQKYSLSPRDEPAVETPRPPRPIQRREYTLPDYSRYYKYEKPAQEERSRTLFHPQFNQPRKSDEKKDEEEAGPSLRPCIPFGLGSSRPNAPQTTRTFFKSSYGRSTYHKDDDQTAGKDKAAKPGQKPDKNDQKHDQKADQKTPENKPDKKKSGGTDGASKH